MAIRFLPDGRMLVLQKKGIIRIANVLSTPIESAIYMNLADPAHSAGLESDQERGLQDVAIDPDFPTSPYIYIYYTAARGLSGPRGRIARFTHIANSGGVTSRGDLSSELLLWQDTDGYDASYHYGGGLSFGPDGNLWLPLGDHYQGAYASNLQKAGGKIHRITKAGGIPAGNPYSDGIGPNVDSIFAYGLRNPFRSRWDLPSGRLFIGEVGGDDGLTACEDLHVLRYVQASGRFVDNDYGTASDNGGYDGINFGWPTVQGMPPHTDFPGAIIDAVGEPIFSYRHDNNHAAIIGGLVYRGTRFPSEYRGAYFYADFTRGFIRYLKFNSDGSVAPNPSPGAISVLNPDSVSYSFDLSPMGRIVYMDVGPDGALYYVSFTDSSIVESNPATPGGVRRYIYTGANPAPVLPVVPGLVLRLESDAGVTQNANIVSQWNDQSGSANDVIGSGNAQLGAALTPSGRPAITLNGTSGKLERTAALSGFPTGNEDRTMFLVAKYNTAAAWAGASYGSGANNQAFGLIVKDTGELGLQGWGGGNDFISATPGIGAGWLLQEGVLASGTVSSATLYKDSVLIGEFAHTYNTVISRFVIGQEISNAGYVGMDVAAVLFYNRALSASERSSIEGYLRTKYLDGGAPPNRPPLVTITAPGNFANFAPGTSINFTATANDPEQGSLSSSIQWSSSLDGAVGTGGSISRTLTTGTHIISASATDNGNLTGSANITVNVTSSPSGGLITSGLVLQLESDSNVTTQGGTTVTGWLDQSGSGNDLVGSGSAQIGTVLSPSGLPAISLNGTTSKLERTGALGGFPAGSGDRTMFLVAKYNSSTAFAGAAYGTGADNQAFGLGINPTGQLLLQGWGGGNDLISTTPGIGAGWLIQEAVMNNGVATLFKDGTQIGQFTHTYNTVLTKLVIGQEISTSGYVGADVAAFLVYNRALTPTERASVEVYLHTKFFQTAPPNTAPTVSITAPANNSSFVSGASITFTGTANDAEQGNLSASIQWSSSLNGALGTGNSITTSTLPVGTHTITASATDNGGLKGSASISITVTAPGNTAPVVAITAPANNASFASGASITFTGTANDAQQGDLGASIQWSSDLDGSLGTGASITKSSLKVGTHTITASVTDSGGLKGSASISITVTTPANTAPVVAITAPANHASFAAGASITFTGTANDAQQGNLGASIQWSSDLDGSLGTGASITTSSLKVGTHTITASVTDSGGLKGSASISITVIAPANTAPIVAITAPANNASFASGKSVTFTGTANDAEQGNLTASIQWTSSRDGLLGTGATVSHSLSAGLHTITASATDINHLTGNASITVKITSPPGLLTSGLVLLLESDLSVTSNNGVVSGWVDLSGKGNDLAPAGSPRIGVAQTPSTKPSIRFDGISSKLERSQSLNSIPSGDSDRTLFFVVKYNSAHPAAGAAIGRPGNNRAFQLVVNPPRGVLALTGGGGPKNDVVSSTPGFGAGWLVQAAVLANGKATLFKNGTSIGSRNHDYNTVQSRIVIGQSVEGDFAIIDVAAFLIYNRALSPAEIANVESYLERKYLQAPAGAVATSLSHQAVPDELTLLGLEVRDGRIILQYPTLQPIGNYHLHAITNLSTQDLADPANRVESWDKAEIELMGSWERSGINFEYPISEKNAFFRLYIDPGQ